MLSDTSYIVPQEKSTETAKPRSVVELQQRLTIPDKLPPSAGGEPLHSPNLLRLVNFLIMLLGFAVAGVYNLIIAPQSKLILVSVLTLVVVTILTAFGVIFAKRYYGISVTLTLIIIVAISMYATSATAGLNVDPSIFNALWALLLGALLYGRRGLIISSALIIGSYILLTILDAIGILPPPHPDPLELARQGLAINFFIMFIVITLLLGYFLWADERRERRREAVEHRMSILLAENAQLRNRVAELEAKQADEGEATPSQ